MLSVKWISAVFNAGRANENTAGAASAGDPGSPAPQQEAEARVGGNERSRRWAGRAQFTACLNHFSCGYFAALFKRKTPAAATAAVPEGARQDAQQPVAAVVSSHVSGARPVTQAQINDLGKTVSSRPIALNESRRRAAVIASSSKTATAESEQKPVPQISSTRDGAARPGDPKKEAGSLDKVTAVQDTDAGEGLQQTADKSSPTGVTGAKGKQKTSARQHGLAASYKEAQEARERERRSLNPILQLRFPRPNGRTLSEKFMNDTEAGIAGYLNDYPGDPARTFFTYSNAQFGVFHACQNRQRQLFPSPLTQIKAIPVAPLREYLLPLAYFNCDASFLRETSIRALIDGVYTIENTAMRRGVLRTNLVYSNVFSDYDMRLEIISAVPDHEDRDHIIHEYIAGGLAHNDMIVHFGIELLDMLRHRQLRINLCQLMRKFGKADYDLLATLELGSSRDIAGYIDKTTGSYDHALAALRHIERFDAALRSEIVQTIHLAIGEFDKKQQNSLLITTLTDGAYRYMKDKRAADHLIEAAVRVSSRYGLSMSLPFIGNINDLQLMDELFKKHEDDTDPAVQLALLDAALRSPQPERGPRTLKVLKHLLSGNSAEGEYITKLAHLLRKAEPEIRNNIVDSFFTHDSPRIAFQGACLKADFSTESDIETRTACLPIIVSGLKNQYNLFPDAYDLTKLFGLLFIDKFEGVKLELSFLVSQNPDVQSKFTEFLFAVRGEPRYAAMLEELSGVMDYDLPAAILSGMSSNIQIAGKEEFDFLGRIIKIHQGKQKEALMPISDMAKNLEDFWRALANPEALRQGYDVFQDTVSRMVTHSGIQDSNMPELEALCLLTSLTDPRSKMVPKKVSVMQNDDGIYYDGCDLREILSGYQKFLRHALKPQSYGAFGMMGDRFDEAEMRQYIESRRATILRAMIIFQNGIVYEAFETMRVRFEWFIKWVETAMPHSEVLRSLHHICHSIDSERHSGADHAYKLLAFTNSFFVSGQKNALINALEEFVVSANSFAERERLFAFRYLALQYPIWNFGPAPTDGEIDKVSRIFDMSHIYLLGTNLVGKNQYLRRREQERLRAMLAAAAQDRFPEWMREDKGIAEANDNTERRFGTAFHSNREAFNLWTSSNLELFFTNTSGVQCRLACWKRQPGKDVFLGNHTGVCTAIGSTNPAAIVEELVFYLVQQLELTDAKSGKILGSSLLFFAEAKGYDSPVLIADHLVANHRMRYDLSIRENMINWMKQFSRLVAGRETPIFLGKNLHFLSTEGLEDMRTLTLSVIGSTDNNLLYANSLDENDGWSDISKPHTVDLLVLFEPEAETSGHENTG